MTTVAVNERRNRKECHNPTSGHSWTEYGRVIGYEVSGCLGVISCHKTAEKAEEVRQEWQAFYDKFGL